MAFNFGHFGNLSPGIFVFITLLAPLILRGGFCHNSFYIFSCLIHQAHSVVTNLPLLVIARTDFVGAWQSQSTTAPPRLLRLTKISLAMTEGEAQ